MDESTFDRNDPESAKQVMTEQCPDIASRRLILAQLLRSVAAAEKLAPESWAVTLFQNGFRLNVGSVEALIFFDGEVRLLLLGSVPTAALQFGTTQPMAYRSMPQPQHCFRSAIKQFAKVITIIEPLHNDFVSAAAVTASGEPRRSSYAGSHSPGLHIYAREFVAAKAVL